MRKYQQLGLVVISLISVGILLMYRSENSRLKYVLEVVNFFGRSDAVAFVKSENNTKYYTSIYDFANPTPLWQRLGNDFHAYSAFWSKNELSAGGEALALVVGLQAAMVNFKCELRYANDKMVTGKFGFIRIEPGENDELLKKNAEDFTIYKFICKVSRDFGTPDGISFVDTKQEVRHYVPVRSIKSSAIKHNLLMNVCLDLIPKTMAKHEDFLSEANLLQFFFHYKMIGIDEFIVYDFNLLTPQIKEVLYKNGIKLNVLQYNFPFDLASQSKKRAILEADCVLRNANGAKYVIVAELNEYLYPNDNLRLPNSFLKSINSFPREFNRFEISVMDVCVDPRIRILSDNLKAPVDKTGDAFFVFKPEYRRDAAKTKVINMESVFLHRYVSCLNKTNLYDWRQKINTDFLLYTDQVGRSVKNMFVGL